MNSMPFRQLKSFLKILIGVQYEKGYHQKKRRIALRVTEWRIGDILSAIKQLFSIREEGKCCKSWSAVRCF